MTGWLVIFPALKVLGYFQEKAVDGSLQKLVTSSPTG